MDYGRGEITREPDSAINLTTGPGIDLSDLEKRPPFVYIVRAMNLLWSVVFGSVHVARSAVAP